MLNKIFQWLYFFTNWDRIPPLPRGFYGADYDRDTLKEDERRVLSRIGARDPYGIKRAMKKHKVNTIAELEEKLLHYKPKRRVWERFIEGIGNLWGGYDHNPHAKALYEDFKRSKSKPNKEIEARLKRTQKLFRKEDK